MRKANYKATVAEALKKEVGKGIARLDSEIMDSLNLKSGDIILIKGKKESAVKLWRSRVEDKGKNIIRIDRTARKNAGTSLGEEIELKKIETKEAKSMTIAPTDEIQFSGDPTQYLKDLLIDRPFKKNDLIEFDIMGSAFHFLVTNTNPSGVLIFTSESQLIVSDKAVKKIGNIPKVSYEDIGGLKDEIQHVREMIELPLKHPEIFERLGITPPKGVLLTGPPGCGKTLLAKAVANESQANFYSLAGPEIMSKWYGQSEENLRKVFEEASKKAPSIIFIDEIDSIAPKREEVTGEVERRVVAQLLTLMDGLESRGNVVVIAATNRPNALDPALRRPGRFDREIRINVPNAKGRKEILQIHTRGMPLAKDVNIDKLAEITLAYTGADLSALAKEAAMKALKEFMPEFKKYEEKIPSELLKKIEIKTKHFIDAYRNIEPSAMREVLITKPNVRWSDIGGLKKVKEKLVESIEWPLKEPRLFEKIGINSPKGILLFGPSGCGKTLLAKAIAREADANFISVKGPELISKWVGESEKHVRELFKKARQVSPSIVFFDEFDAISQVRGHSLSSETDRVINQLLTELDGIEELEKVIVIAATNRVELIDPALLRPGRIDLKIEIPMPNETERKEIFEVHTKKMNLDKKVNLKELAKKTDKMTGADIKFICNEAGMNTLREFKKGKRKKLVVLKEDFEKVLKKLKENKKKK